VKLDLNRVLGWALPLVCMAVAAVLIIRQNSALQEANGKLLDAQRAETMAAAAKDLADKQSGKMRFAAAPATQNEESKFLDGLKIHAAAAGVKITRWNSRAGSTTAPAEAAEADPALHGITKRSGDLTLNGSFEAIRSFLVGMSQTNRLYTFSDMRWSRNEKGLELTTTISRYVEPSSTQMAAETSPQKKT
jgi:hypothetical protein